MLGLDPDHLDLGAQRFHRPRYSRDHSAAPYGRYDGVDVLHLLQDFERDGALPRDSWVRSSSSNCFTSVMIATSPLLQNACIHGLSRFHGFLSSGKKSAPPVPARR